MRQLRRLARLSGREIALLARCLIAVAGVRLGLTLLTYKRLSRLIARAPNRSPSTTATPEQIARAVSAAARLVPAASCLTQALSAQLVLRRYGYASSIQLGVAPHPTQVVKAHAWLTCGGEVLLGGSPARLAEYKFLTELSRVA